MGYGLSATFGSNGPGASSNNANYHTEDDNTAITSSKPSLNPIYLAQDMAIVWVISVALSILAGLFPAWKASRYLPIEALRSQ
jgi:putative ABC transport system permease protein